MIREAAAAVAVFGFFAASWFGWAQENPPASWRRWLVVGSVGAMVMAVVGGVMTWQRWDEASVFAVDGRRIGIWFGIIVLLEVVIGAVGGVVLSRRGRPDLVAPWVAIVVSVHFVPLAPLLEYPLLYGVAAAVVVVAIASVSLARKRQLAVSATTGAGTGSVLVSASLISLALAIA